MTLFNSNSTKMIDIMQRSMTASTMKTQVINNNIANASTPNYKRQDITFQSELERALLSEKQELSPFTMTNEKHIPVYRLYCRPVLCRKRFTVRNKGRSL